MEFEYKIQLTQSLLIGYIPEATQWYYNSNNIKFYYDPLSDLGPVLLRPLGKF